ncbi:hypothetical protein PAESOLCIP111_03305 [Paenibacillus solanacearum]|uniref:Uncharacterized protein n=1 Tax=Paenibacillus solanacearum TaxID=2048548 RepID=A0A916K2K8_9BACL|nr:hypothetical protein [Paenibacillus solanacearum]CAG7631506.1 hypothetical protein PAESOLCIP111_03305 [Paenibacillus solanacearum]
MGAQSKSSKGKGHPIRKCRCVKKRRTAGRGNVVRRKTKKENSNLENVTQGVMENATRGNLTQGVADKENATRGHLTHGHRTRGNAAKGAENHPSVSPLGAPHGFWL